MPCTRVIATQGCGLPAGAPPAQLDLGDVRNAPYLWHKAPDFVKDDVRIALIMRMATIQDKRPAEAPKHTRRLWNLPADQVCKARSIFNAVQRQSCSICLYSHVHGRVAGPCTHFAKVWYQACLSQLLPRRRNISGAGIAACRLG